MTPSQRRPKDAPVQESLFRAVLDLNHNSKEYVMKRLIGCLSAVALAAFLTGCAGVQSPLVGGVYKDVTAPIMATSNATVTKKGEASATSILGIVATGDASIQAAAANAGITKIHHVDYHAKSVLMFWAKYTTTVYGE